MRSIVDRYLPEPDRERIRSCVREIETTTSGQLVPMVVGSSHHYPGAGLLLAQIAAFVVAFAASAIVFFSRLWKGFQPVDVWVFPAVFGAVFFAVAALERRFPHLRQFFVHKSEREEEVAEAAFTAFHRHGLTDTRGRNGVLIFISLFERKVHVVADEGIHRKVGDEAWRKAVDIMVSGFKSGSAADAICEGLRYCGRLLAEHFPRKPGDSDELETLIVEK